MIGLGSYADTSRLMDDNLRAFKGYSQEVDNVNKQLMSQADQKENINDLRKVGEEFAIKQGKDLLFKYGAKMYSGKIPFSKYSIQDLDKKAGSVLDDAADRIFSAGKNIGDPGVSSGSLNTTRIGNSRLNAGESLDESGFGNLEEIPEVSSEGNNLARFIQQQKEVEYTPPSEPEPAKGGEIEMQEKPMEVEMRPMKAIEGDEIAEAGQATEDIGQASGDIGLEAGGAIEKEAGSALSEVAEKAGVSAASDAVAETTAQAVGLGLDATGVLAPLGALVSLGADIFALFEAGKTTADFVERDITHTKVAPTPDLIPKPTAPQTIAQKGYAVTPSLDTYDIAHTSIAHGW